MLLHVLGVAEVSGSVASLVGLFFFHDRFKKHREAYMLFDDTICTLVAAQGPTQSQEIIDKTLGGSRRLLHILLARKLFCGYRPKPFIARWLCIYLGDALRFFGSGYSQENGRGGMGLRGLLAKASRAGRGYVVAFGVVYGLVELLIGMVLAAYSDARARRAYVRHVQDQQGQQQQQLGEEGEQGAEEEQQQQRLHQD